MLEVGVGANLIPVGPASEAVSNNDVGVTGSAMPDLRHASFFSGIGGFDLGFAEAGIRTVSLCEKKPFCQRVLRARWPEVPLLEDVTNVDPSEIPEAEIWSAGFPCQDLSLARMGARAGLRGAQSGLFFDFAALVSARRPQIVVLENVHGLLTSHRGRDFAIVLKTLDELGYGVAWRVLNSQHFGIPQSRRRVFVVAVYRDPIGAGEILLEPECGDGNPKKSGSHGKKSPSLFQRILGDPVKGPLVKARAHCIYAESARHTGTDWSRNYVWYPDGRVRRLTPLEVERIQGFPPGWTEIEEMAGEEGDSARYHAVGNSVTPAVASWLGSRLVTYFSDRAHSGAAAGAQSTYAAADG